MLLRLLLMRGLGVVLMLGGALLLFSQFPLLIKGGLERLRRFLPGSRK